jgi:RNA 3'-terminal phosphate cyclase
VRDAQAACGKGTTELLFGLGEFVGRDIRLDVGTADAVTLVLQTLLPALVCASGRAG